EIDNFTGVSSPYEEPKAPDLIIDTTQLTLKESVKKILELTLANTVLKEF
ncbi:MAG: adenylyl-sulfate kinase, partial [Candidatus Aureabacteria bacterium]|nr:adenylyl-sulfate kinase [Candidatus Auribacterota bacterium]